LRRVGERFALEGRQHEPSKREVRAGGLAHRP
jgi:hypothetical protein